MIKDEVKSGIIEAVPEHNYDQAPIQFLPHHGVFRSDRETTKLKVLIDGSAKVIHIDIERHSVTRLLCVTAYLLQFIRNGKKSVSNRKTHKSPAEQSSNGT